jgi:hypothetical protein
VKDPDEPPDPEIPTEVQVPKRPTLRRVYDIEDLSKLLAADLEIEIHPLCLPDKARQKIIYWIGRAYDAGRANKP